MLARFLGALLLLGSLQGPAVRDSTADQAPQLSIRADPNTGFRAVLHVGGILNDHDLEEAARSGLPLRLRVRVELWKDGFIDDVAGSETWSLVLVYEPLENQFVVGRRTAAGGLHRYASYTSASGAVQGDYFLSLQPTQSGRYYYTASLQIETLSLSDLEELERWLQGELEPAVSGDRSLPGALGQGAKRLMIRLLRLPTRHSEARSPRFEVPTRKR